MSWDGTFLVLSFPAQGLRSDSWFCFAFLNQFKVDKKANLFISESNDLLIETKYVCTVYIYCIYCRERAILGLYSEVGDREVTGNDNKGPSLES